MTSKKLNIVFALIIGMCITPVVNGQWHTQTIGTAKYRDVYFPDHNTGYVISGDAGVDYVMKTIDGGTTWNKIVTSSTPFPRGNAVWFVSSDTGFITGLNGILKTTDGGNSWTNYPISKARYYNDICFVDKDTGYVTGSDSSHKGFLVKTTDGGATWNILNSVVSGRITFTSADTGYISRGGVLYRTIDYGETWDLIKTFDIGMYDCTLDFFFLRHSTFGYVILKWEVGSGCPDYGFYKTIDGINWTQIKNYNGGPPIAVSFISKDAGFLVIENNVIARTEDGGANWSYDTLDKYFVELNTSIYFLDRNKGCIVSDSGLICMYISNLYFVQQPVNKYIAKDSSVSYQVIAGGIAPFSYQWYKDGNKIIGATDSILKIINAQYADSGNYQCSIKNAYDSLISVKAKLTVLSYNPLPPAITKQPESLTVDEGDTAAFSVSAAGFAPLTFQWFKIGSGSTVGVDSVISWKAGKSDDKKMFYCRITNPIGSVNSDTVTLNVVAKIVLEENTNENLKVYPNPANELITIETTCSGPLEIQLLNMQGVTVLSKSVSENSGAITIQLPKDMNKGVYCLVVKCRDNVVSEKIIIE